MDQKSVFRRVGGLIVITVLVLVGFVLRLVQFQLVQGEDLLAQAQAVTNYKFRITAARGDIVDQYGRSLATNASGYNLALNKLMLTGEVNDMLRELIEILQASGDGWNDTVPISAPENGVTAQYTWLTTSDGALGHLRVAFGRSAPWRRVVLVTDGARALCCGRNIPLRARELLARGGAAEVLAAVRESRPEDDASCIVLDRAPLEENAPRKCAAPACEIASNLV